MSALLRLENVCHAFGGVKALDRVSLEVEEGSITAIIGPNGAGKTTAINCTSGIYRPEGGEVFFRGKNVTGMGAHRLAARGLTRTFQNLQVFGQLTVLENVMTGLHISTRGEFLAAMFRLPGLNRQEKQAREQAREVLALLGLEDLAPLPAGGLSYGDRKRLELARALAAKPKLILLDEPVAGLNPAETDRMGEVLAGIRDMGVSLVLVEHDMGLVMRVSDQVVVLHFGRKIAQGTCHEIQNNPQVIQIYLGGAGRELGPIA